MLKIKREVNDVEERIYLDGKLIFDGDVAHASDLLEALQREGVVEYTKEYVD